MKEYKHEYEDSEKYVNHNALLSHDADISLSQSIRNLGKSYDGMRLIKKNMDNGFNGCWERWDKTELGIAKNEVLEFLQKDSDVGLYTSFKIKDSTASYIVNNDTGGKVYFFAVKLAASYKGLDIPALRWEIYDEYIPEFYDIRTRRDIEFDKFMSLHTTLKRENKKFRSLLMCNCIDWFTGYTKTWKITPFNAGLIRVYDNKISVEYNGETIEGTSKIAFENVKPSIAMLQRTISNESLRGDSETAQKYYNNVIKKMYTLIDVCPDSQVPLQAIQFRRGDTYYSYRIYEGIYYVCKCGYRNSYPTDVFCHEGMRPGELRRTSLGSQLEQLINAGCMRFDSGYTYNDFIQGIWEYRKRI